MMMMMTPTRCGAGCRACPRPQQGTGRATCVRVAGSATYACDVRCSTGFLRAQVNGTWLCKQSRYTGLQSKGRGLGTPSKKTEQLKRYTGLRTSAQNVRNLGTQGAPPSSAADLLQAACGSTAEAQCLYKDTLLLALTPATYSSNNSADTPGGYSFISPSQDQGSCQSCVGFAATAAAEAAINVYMKQNWDKLDLSEQDVTFCRFAPAIDCTSGAQFEDLVKNVNDGKLLEWASRTCYPYTARPSSDCWATADPNVCPSQTPAGGQLSMAYYGSALSSMALVKEQIMLSGGVITSMAVTPTFTYPGPGDKVYTASQQLQDPQLHAVFCYGWNDTGGWWLCKNSWGRNWGSGGSFKIAYGASYIMPPDYTYAMRFGPNMAQDNPLLASKAADLRAKLLQGSQPDPSDSTCLLYSPSQATRLIHLYDDLVLLAQATRYPIRDTRVYLEDLVLFNLGRSADITAASWGPFRVCGRTRGILGEVPGAVNSPSPSPARPPLPSPAPASTDLQAVQVVVLTHIDSVCAVTAAPEGQVLCWGELQAALGLAGVNKLRGVKRLVADFQGQGVVCAITATGVVCPDIIPGGFRSRLTDVPAILQEPGTAGGTVIGLIVKRDWEQHSNGSYELYDVACAAMNTSSKLVCWGNMWANGEPVELQLPEGTLDGAVAFGYARGFVRVLNVPETMYVLSSDGQTTYFVLKTSHTLRPTASMSTLFGGGSSGVVSVSGAYSDTTCELHIDGRAVCRSGYYYVKSSFTDAQDIFLDRTGVRAVVASYSFACIVLKANGSVECHAINMTAPYPERNLVQLPVPTGLDEAVDIAAGRHYACIIKKSGKVACWCMNLDANGVGDNSDSCYKTVLNIPKQLR